MAQRRVAFQSPRGFPPKTPAIGWCLQPTPEFTSELLKNSPKESNTVTYAFSPLSFFASKIASGYDFNWIAQFNWQFQSPWLIAADPESNSTGSLIILVVGLAVGAGMAFLVNFLMGKDAKSQSKRLLEQTKLDCDNLAKSAEIEKKEALLQLQSKFDKENQKQRDELRKKESELDKRETALKQASDDLKKQERFVENNQRKLSEKIEDAQRKSDLYNKLIQQQQADLQRVTGMSKEEAQKQLLSVLERDLQSEMGSVILKHEKRVNETLQQKTQDILLTSMQRYASSQTAESTTSTVDIPNDEMKGRIIGREGRNIRAFEKISGCDLIIDDTPGVVIVSGFDPVRREIARASMEKLVTDGRIHPSRIEEIVAATEAQIEAFIKRKGEEAAQEVNIQGLHERTINMLGRLHFRTSYSQNVLRHSVEGTRKLVRISSNETAKTTSSCTLPWAITIN